MQSKPEPAKKTVLIREAIGEAVSILRSGGVVNPFLEAELLLANLLAVDRVKILLSYDQVLEDTVGQQYQNQLQQRAKGYPLQYLTGRQEFMSLNFWVAPPVLIPRADTEILVEKVLDLQGRMKKNPAIVDVGAGSGAIAVALAYYWPRARVSAVDISPRALAIAKKNAAQHGVKIDFFQGDLLAPFINSNEKFDIVVSNPPYISTAEMKQLPKDVQHEPKLALDGGFDGLEYYRRLIPQAREVLADGGMLALEIGWDQGLVVSNLLEQNWFAEIEIIKDYVGRDRVVLSRK
ncbi:MAG: peptide chain release factor N(5)-glutamine methyltransferase [Bacillota bacterium]